MELKMLKPTAQIAKARISQGAGDGIGTQGGWGYLYRRGVDTGTYVNLQSLQALTQMAVTQPMTLTLLLSSIIPELDFAEWTYVMLGCSPDTARIKAMPVGTNGRSEEDPAGSQEIEQLFNNLPPEVGSFEDARAQMLRTILYTGMSACEAVPGGRNAGVAAVYPINSLTLRFRREADGTLTLHQRQAPDVSGLGTANLGLGGAYVELPPTVFWAKTGGMPDEPYGKAPLAPVISAVFQIMSFILDLGAAWHRVGNPRIDIGFDFAAAADYARNSLNLTDDNQISDYQQKAFNETVSLFNSLSADDAFFHDVNSKVNILPAGTWSNLKETWQIHKSRLTKALKMLPALMGDAEGKTESWSEVEERIFTNGLSYIVSASMRPFVEAAKLHFRLQGKPFTAELEIKLPKNAFQRQADAQAQALEIQNQAQIRDQGWQDQESASMTVTGSAAVAEPRSWLSQTAPEPKPADPQPHTD